MIEALLPPVPSPAILEACERQPREAAKRVAELQGHGPIDPALLDELLDPTEGLPIGLGQVRLRRLCVDQSGQVVAADVRAAPLGQVLGPVLLSDTEPPGSASVLARLLSTLHAGLPQPPPRVPRYRPSAGQVRVVAARDRTCTFPGCSRRACRTDLDHRVPHPRGATATSNLHALCRHHHRLKHDGWRVWRRVDGTTAWTSPRGRITVRTRS